MKKQNLNQTKIAICATLLATSSVSQAAVFANGSFESGVSPWITSAGGGVTLSPTSFGSGASDGSAWIQFGTDGRVGGTLSQTFDTLDGQEYAVTFDYGKYGNPAGAGALRVSVDNTAATSADYSDTTGSAYVSNGSAFTTGTDTRSTVFTFTASSASTTLTFADISTNGARHDVTLDNVILTTVPEPSSTALLGLGGLALILRRRK